MAITIQELGIDRLSVEERLALIDQIWDSLPPLTQPDEVPEWHMAEQASRQAAVDATPCQGKPWREALARFGDGGGDQTA